MFSRSFSGRFRACRPILKQECGTSKAQHSTSSIDVENMKVLSDMRQDWWNPQGSSKALHAMNAMRIPFIREGLISTGLVDKTKQNTARVLEGLNILDVGCGGGILTESLAKLRANVVGLEPSAELLQVAQEHANLNDQLKSNLSYKCGTIEDFSSDEANFNRFDCVILSEVIEHVNSPEAFLKECLKPVKPGGSLFLTTFNKTISSLVLGIGVAEYVLRLVPENTHQWEKFIPLDDMHKMIESNNCSVLQTTGILYNPFNNSWKVTRNTDVSYAIHAVKQS